MNNYKEEIAKLQTQLDELKSKIEKPQFEVGKWYVLNCDYCFLVNISEIKDNSIYGYGFNYYGTHNEYIENPKNNWVNIESLNSYHLATPKEVEEALIKEAVKRGFKEGTKYYSAMWDDETLGDSSALNWRFKQETNTLYMNGMNGIVFHNGKWATQIKTKTIDEIGYELSGKATNVIINYLTENKQEIIETLNSL